MKDDLRFVVLTHDHPVLHWDFLLEEGGALRTWRLAHPPDTPGPIAGQALAPHRLAYLDYEGPVSGNRGTVTRWDAGTWRVDEWTETRVRVRLEGSRLIGTAQLDQTADADACWEFRFLANSGTGFASP